MPHTWNNGVMEYSNILPPWRDEMKKNCFKLTKNCARFAHNIFDKGQGSVCISPNVDSQNYQI